MGSSSSKRNKKVLMRELLDSMAYSNAEYRYLTAQQNKFHGVLPDLPPPPPSPLPPPPPPPPFFGGCFPPFPGFGGMPFGGSCFPPLQMPTCITIPSYPAFPPSLGACMPSFPPPLPSFGCSAPNFPPPSAFNTVYSCGGAQPSAYGPSSHFTPPVPSQFGMPAAPFSTAYKPQAPLQPNCGSFANNYAPPFPTPSRQYPSYGQPTSYAPAQAQQPQYSTPQYQAPTYQAPWQPPQNTQQYQQPSQYQAPQASQYQASQPSQYQASQPAAPLGLPPKVFSTSLVRQRSFFVPAPIQTAQPTNLPRLDYQKPILPSRGYTRPVLQSEALPNLPPLPSYRERGITRRSTHQYPVYEPQYSSTHDQADHDEPIQPLHYGHY